MHNLIKKPLNENDKKYILSIANNIFPSHSWAYYLIYNRYEFTVYNCNFCNLYYLTKTKGLIYIVSNNKIGTVEEMLSCEELIIKNLLE